MVNCINITDSEHHVPVFHVYDVCVFLVYFVKMFQGKFGDEFSLRREECDSPFTIKANSWDGLYLTIHTSPHGQSIMISQFK